MLCSPRQRKHSRPIGASVSGRSSHRGSGVAAGEKPALFNGALPACPDLGHGNAVYSWVGRQSPGGEGAAISTGARGCPRRFRSGPLVYSVVEFCRDGLRNAWRRVSWCRSRYQEVPSICRQPPRATRLLSSCCRKKMFFRASGHPVIISRDCYLVRRIQLARPRQRSRRGICAIQRACKSGYWAFSGIEIKIVRASSRSKN